MAISQSGIPQVPQPQLGMGALPAQQVQLPKQGFWQNIREGLFGSNSSLQQFPRFTPQQAQLQSNVLSQLPELLQRAQSNQFNFAPIAQQARTQFQTETVPSLAERFSALGTGGSQRSSAFQQALGKAGAGLEENLAALQSKYNLAQGGQQNQLLQILLALANQPQFESAYFPSQPGFFQALGGAAAQGLGTLGPLLALGLL